MHADISIPQHWTKHFPNTDPGINCSAVYSQTYMNYCYGHKALQAGLLDFFHDIVAGKE